MPFINFPDNPSIGDTVNVSIYKYVWTGDSWDREIINIDQLKQNLKNSIIDDAPEALNTLNELAAALGNDADFATTVTNLIATKADSGDVATALNGKLDKTGGAVTGGVTFEDGFNGFNSAEDSSYFFANATNVVVQDVPFRVRGSSGVDILETFPFDGNTAYYKNSEIVNTNSLSAALTPKADKTLDIGQRNSSYTLVLADAARVLTVDSTSTRTITIPTDAAVNFPMGTEIAIVRLNTGVVSISPTSGVTLNSIDNKRNIKGRYGSAVILKIGTNSWVLIGSLE